MDANHCPGAAQLLFKVPSGETYVHCGDMRFRSAPSLKHRWQRECCFGGRVGGSRGVGGGGLGSMIFISSSKIK